MTQFQSATARVPARLLQYWWVIVLSALLGGALAFGYSSIRTPIFHSEASVYFSMRSATSGSDINQGSAYTQNQMLSFARLATSSVVLDAVSNDLRKGGVALSDAQLRRAVSVSIPQNTVVLDVTGASSDPEVAADLANSVAENLADVVYDIAPKGENGESTVEARVITPASVPQFQTSPNKSQDSVLGIIVGALAAVLVLTAWILMDRRVRSASALAEVSDLPLLGTVPRRPGRAQGVAMLTSPNGAMAESFRHVRSGLKFAAVGRSVDVLAVTSSIASEGKTTVSVNLAAAYAEMGLRVVLVDADLRRPAVADKLGLENAIGLSTVLVDAVDIDTAILPTAAGVDVITAGEHAPNPAQLLASDKMKRIVDDLRSRYDLVVIDTAPLLSVADATIISQYADSTVVVVNTRKTAKGQLERCLQSLSAVGAHLAGFVLNNVREQKKEMYLYTTPKS